MYILKRFCITTISVCILFIFYMAVNAEGMDCTITLISDTLKITDYNLSGGISASVNNTSGGNMDSFVYLAIYDDTDNVVTSASKDIALQSGVNNISFDSIEFSGIESESYTYKIYVWDKQSQKPLCEAIGNDIAMDGYAYVLDAYTFQDSLGNIGVCTELLSINGVESFDAAKSLSITQTDGKVVLYDTTNKQDAEDVVTLLKSNRTILFNRNQGLISTVKTPNSDGDSLSFSKSGDFKYDLNSMKIGDEQVDENTTVLFVNTGNTDLSENRRVSELVYGEIYKSAYTYYNLNVTKNVSCIVVFDADNIPKHVDVPKKEPAFSYTNYYGYRCGSMCLTTVDDGFALRTGMVTKDGPITVYAYDTLDIMQSDGTYKKYNITNGTRDECHEAFEKLADCKAVLYTLYKGKLKAVTPADTVHGGFKKVASGTNKLPFKYDKSNSKIGTYTVDENTVIYFMNDGQDLQDGMFYICDLYYDSDASQSVSFMVVSDMRDKAEPDPVIIDSYSYVLNTSAEQDSFGNGSLQIKLINDKYGIETINASKVLYIMQPDGTYKTYDTTNYDEEAAAANVLLDNRVLYCKFYDNELKYADIPNADQNGSVLKVFGIFKYSKSDSKIGDYFIKNDTRVFFVDSDDYDRSEIGLAKYEFTDGYYYNVDLYFMGENKTPVIVTKSLVSPSSPMAVIGDVEITYSSEDDNLIYCIYFYMDGQMYHADTTADVYDALSVKDTISEGDIYKFKICSGIIDKAECVIDFDDPIRTKVKSTADDGTVKCKINEDYTVKPSNEYFVSVVLDDSYNEETHCITIDGEIYDLDEATNIYIYDPEKSGGLKVTDSEYIEYMTKLFEEDKTVIKVTDEYKRIIYDKYASPSGSIDSLLPYVFLRIYDGKVEGALIVNSYDYDYLEITYE